MFYLLKTFSEEQMGTLGKGSKGSKNARKITIDIDLVDMEGNTCLHLAVKRCHTDANAISMVNMLIEKGLQL